MRFYALFALVVGGALLLGIARFATRDAPASRTASVSGLPDGVATPTSTASTDSQPRPKAVARPKSDNSISNWEGEFYSTDNLFPLVKRAALAAINQQDVRAAYFVSQSLSACAAVYQSAQRDPNFEASFDIEYAKLAPKAPEWARAKARREFDRCVQFAKEDPFSDLPPRAEGYRQSAYSQDLAVANSRSAPLDCSWSRSDFSIATRRHPE